MIKCFLFALLLTGFSIQAQPLQQFAGHDVDVETGLVYAKTRYLENQSGRFTSPDPLYIGRPSLCISREKECELLQYATGNPVNVMDPNGQSIVSAIKRGAKKIKDKILSFRWKAQKRRDSIEINNVKPGETLHANYFDPDEPSHTNAGSNTASKIRRQTGTYDAAMHGGPDGLYPFSPREGKYVAKSGYQMAGYLARRLSLVAGDFEQVRLISCHTACPGKYGSAPGQQMADALDMPVLAPTSEVTVPAVAGDPKLGEGGMWYRFEPRPIDDLDKNAMEARLKVYQIKLKTLEADTNE